MNFINFKKLTILHNEENQWILLATEENPAPGADDIQIYYNIRTRKKVFAYYFSNDTAIIKTTKKYTQGDLDAFIKYCHEYGYESGLIDAEWYEEEYQIDNRNNNPYYAIGEPVTI